MKCSDCEHCKWEEGDHSESPPGYGLYYCDLNINKSSALNEDEAKGKTDPKNCPLAFNNS